MTAEIVLLSKFRTGRSERPVHAITVHPDIRKLELALIICELAISWNVDLALVAAIRDGKIK